MLNIKNKILKIIFRISALPLIGVILFAIYNSITGVEFLWEETYGLEAFVLTIFGCFLEVPPLLICLVYPIFSIIRHFIKKHKSKNVVVGNNKDIILKIIFILSLFSVFFISGPVLIFILCLAYQIFYITRHFIKKHKSKNVVVAPQGDLQNKN